MQRDDKIEEHHYSGGDSKKDELVEHANCFKDCLTPS